MRTVTGTNQRTEDPVGLVVALEELAALRIDVTGAKAAALAQAARAGLPVLPGRVITTAASVLAAPHAQLESELHAAWWAMSAEGTLPVVVRSSSVLEDGRASSMAGMFTSVLDVWGWEPFRAAFDTVVESAAMVGTSPADPALVPAPRAPMAVLIQRQLDSAVGGVMFGVDPVSGRNDRLVISASEAGPAAVVGGEVDGSRYVVAGRRLISQPDDGGPLSHSQVRHLARMARHAERVFGGPQDIEWAVDTDGRMWLLQSRPVTAIGAASGARGPLLGSGPVAETFPDALSPLEEDLWLVPLRDGLRSALGVVGTTPRRRLAASPIIVSIGGRVAADLDLLGPSVENVSISHRFDPRPPVRRLAAAWRVGRLRAALPALAADLVATADQDLLAVSRLSELSDAQLMAILRRSRQGLVALHGYEVLIGSLVASDASSITAASAGLRTLVAARRAGTPDHDVIVRHPGVLALTAPTVASPASLPATNTDFAMPPLDTGAPSPGRDAAVMREALRLRARWVQELTARAAWELASRMQDRGLVASREIVRLMSLDELAAAVHSGVVPAEVTARRAAPSVPPLPATFRLNDDGAVVAVASSSKPGTSDGTGAAAGRGMGVVHSGEGMPGPGCVLVVRTLDPGLASVLPRLSGLVAETGSVLSHLAILAREFGIPTVVGVADALVRFPPGSEVVVDGTVGTVTVLGAPTPTKAPA